jgi:hypothetical protein
MKQANVPGMMYGNPASFAAFAHFLLPAVFKYFALEKANALTALAPPLRII